MAFIKLEQNLVYITTAIVVASLLFHLIKATSKWSGAPPGPRTVPLLGNLHQLPRKDLHLQYQKWGEQYGPIFSLKLGSQNMVVLTSGEMIKKVVDKRSGNYADRPKLYMQEIWQHSRIIMRGYDALWKVERKLYHQFLNVTKAARYIPYQDIETKQLCYDLLNNPSDFEALISRSTTSLATSMTYGFRVVSLDNPVMRELFANTHGFFAMVTQTRKGKEIFLREKAHFHKLYKQVQMDSDLDSSRPSFAADVYTAQKTWKDAATRELLTDHTASYIAGIALEGGSDTTSNTLAGLIKAMMLFPDVQRKVHEELDTVVGDRYPTMDDFESLPYVRQTVKEALRWLPTPISGAIPHAAFADDEIDGYKIPAGTTIVLAVWSANNDARLFPNPREFDPSRHDPSRSLAEAAAAADYKDRDHWTFGAGRRICPGIHVAERTLFLATARLMWAFDIRKARGPDGSEIEVDRDEVTQSIAARPVPFRCDFAPRSEKHARLIVEAWNKAREVLDESGNYKDILIDSENPDHEHLSKPQAKALVQKLAQGLKVAGLKPGNTVCLFSPNNIYQPIICLGTVAAGGVWTGMNPGLSQGEMARHLTNSDTRFIFCCPSLLGKAARAAAECGIPEANIFTITPLMTKGKDQTQNPWTTLLENGSSDWVSFDDEATAKSTTACLYPTSGTSGPPKLAMLSHHNVVAEAILINEIEARNYQVKQVMLWPMFHAASLVWSHITPLRQGWQTYFVSRFDPAKFLDIVDRFKCTDTGMAPAMMMGVLQVACPDSEKQRKLSSLQYGTCGSAPVGAELHRQWRKIIPEACPWNTAYGMTELSSVVTKVHYPAHDNTSSVGTLIPNTSARVFDEKGVEITAYNQPGELFIRGPTVFKGYYKNKSATEECLDSNGFLRTGDVGYIDSETGKVFILDRIKVAPAELESELFGHPGVAEVAVIGIKDARGVECPRAYVVRSPGAEVSEAELVDYLGARLSSYKRLTGGVRFLDAMPRNSNGKMLKKELRELSAREQRSSHL
ncbi:oxidoreductase [Fusarium sp. NRRL 52700]|nr:oxidoreductase [Fusarium sp. NRRL 52700]